MKEARAERSKIIADRSRGTQVKRTKVTLAQAIDDWLAGRRNLRPSTQRNYRDSLELAKVSLGHIQLQELTKAHLDRPGDRATDQWAEDRQRPASELQRQDR
jgi:hypothetical protein